MSSDYKKKTKAELLEYIASLESRNKKLKSDLGKISKKNTDETLTVLGSHFEHSPLPILISTSEGFVKFINAKFISTFGYVLKDIPDIETWAKSAYPDHVYRKQTLNEWEKDIKKAKKNDIAPKTFKVTCKNKKVKDVRFNVIFDPDGYQVVFMEDVTKLIEYEDMLEDKEKKIREIFDNTNDAIYLWDFSDNKLGKCLEVNVPATKMLGYSRKEFFTKTPYDILLPKYHDEVEIFLKGIKGKNKTFFEGEQHSKDGKAIPVEISSRIFKLNNSRVILSIARDITERKNTREQIIASEHRFKSLIDDSPLSIEIYNNKGILIHANAAWEKLWKLDKRKLIGKQDIFKDDRLKDSDISLQLKSIFKKKVSESAIIEYLDENGSKSRSLRINLYPLLDSRKKLNNVVFVTEDISHLIETEKELKASEEKFRKIVENSHSGIMIIDNNFKLTYCNAQFSKVVGYPMDELMGIDFRVFVDTEFKKVVAERYQKRQRGEKVESHYELKIVKKDGTTSWVDLTSSVVRVIDHKPMTIAQVIDINERKTSITVLQASEERFRMIMEQSPVSMQIFNVDGTVLRVNQAWYNLWDITEQEAIFEGYNILRDSQSKKNGFQEAFINAINGHSTTLPEVHYVPESSELPGRERLLHTKIYPLKDETNRVRFIVMINEDITDRKRTESALIESEERYRGLYENATVGIFSATLECNFIMANPAMINIMGYRDFDDMKQGVEKNDCFCNLDDWNYIRKALLAIGEVQGFETRFYRKNKEEIVVLLNAKAIKNKFRQVEYFEGIIEDISERKLAEKAIIEAKEEAEKSNRLKSEFLAQMSHEIRTPINTILSFAGLISDELDDVIPDDLRPSFGIMSNAGKRIIRTIDLILNMSEIQTDTYQPLMKEIDLYDEILYNLYLEYLSNAKEKELALRIHNTANDSLIVGDEYTVGQIFNNLINNAIKYTHRGKIDITIGRGKDKKLYVDVKDTGIGISEDYLPSLFEAFSQEDQGYTRRFEGNGLGLALVQKYCELNEAEIIVKSQKGTGSTFRIVFDPVETVKKKLLKK